jgi:hypothetical protein
VGVRQRALDLLAAVDAGDQPLHTGVVNDIAKQLGIEVSIEVTITRIRGKII